ncbi:MAG: nuclear transport factor 2 family protein [Burkholderiales bacterium]|nr:nuclear transport factor 2 family protein [Burkholderiales bacterium]
MFAVFFAPPSHAAETLSNSQLQQQVFAAERAFARSMAERKFDQFALYVADEAIFYGSKDIWRGKEQVLKAWKGFFDEAKAPFSWEPEVVEVLASGTLAHSSGPVKNDKGETFLYYNSIWRLEAPGVWKVVFDKGSPVPAARAK